MHKIIRTEPDVATVIIRLMVGTVFLSEGIQKFLFADKLGVGRFVKIGIPHPAFFAPFAGTFEIVCGMLVLIGLFTRLAAVPLLIVILVALAGTKLPMLQHDGIWATLHESRADWSMLLGCIFLIMKGGGLYSADYRIDP